MKRTNMYSLLWLTVALCLFSSCAKKEAEIPVTTKSEKALELYREASDAMKDVYIPEAMDLLIKALEEDPDFFMAAYDLATMNFYFGNDAEFNKYAKQAVASEAALSDGEEIMREMLQKLMEDQDADITDLGNQLVELYPKDPTAYSQLAFAQMMNDDYEGVVETLMKTFEITEDSAGIYNSLGYAYMEMGQFDDARSVFDKYIEMKPDLPNPYDSKGDYYMRIEDYVNAYESYMKAYRIDSTWSRNKALRAKELQDTILVE